MFFPYAVLCLAGVFSASLAKPALSRFPISVINLDTDAERMTSISKELQKAGVPRHQVHRLSAVNGKALTAQDLEKNATRLARLFATPGMIGCFLSHR